MKYKKNLKAKVVDLLTLELVCIGDGREVGEGGGSEGKGGGEGKGKEARR